MIRGESGFCISPKVIVSSGVVSCDLNGTFDVEEFTVPQGVTFGVAKEEALHNCRLSCAICRNGVGGEVERVVANILDDNL